MCFYNLSYPNKNLYLLDDTRYDKPWTSPEKVEQYRKDVDELCRWIGVNLFRRKWRGAKAGIINDFMRFRKGETFEQLEFSTYQQKELEPESFIAVFDADMNPFPDFVEPLVEFIQEDPKIAFVQTPQYYSNFETNRVAKAAGLQQVIFFDYICESKGMKDAMFCCGSNVLIRVDALLSVGGFDESSVTEDFATSLKLHAAGWKSVYYNRVSAFGKGPEDLGGFFKQQFRWALGTLQLARQMPAFVIKNFRKLPMGLWWEYLISSTHYLTGCFFFIMFLFPVSYIFFNVPTIFLSPSLYAAVMIPYLSTTLYVVLWTLYLRNYKAVYMLNTVLISGISFPIFIGAAFCALFGIKKSFTVTPKDKCEPYPLINLWPQLLALLICFAALVWGAERIYYERIAIGGLIGNMFWCFYNICIISSFMYFNNPEGEKWLIRDAEPSS